jgi:uncharacterized membrane protein YqjE
LFVSLGSTLSRNAAGSRTRATDDGQLTTDSRYSSREVSEVLLEGVEAMSQLERSAAGQAPARQTDQALADVDSLPSLFGRLGDDVMTLVDAKLGLIKVELKEEAGVYARNGAVMAVGAVLGTVGLLLFTIAVAFFVSKLFSFDDERLNYAMGFVVTSVLFLIIGGALILVMKNRLAAHDPTPHRSLEEIRKDKQWLKNEM